MATRRGGYCLSSSQFGIDAGLDISTTVAFVRIDVGVRATEDVVFVLVLRLSAVSEVQIIVVAGGRCGRGKELRSPFLEARASANRLLAFNATGAISLNGRTGTWL